VRISDMPHGMCAVSDNYAILYAYIRRLKPCGYKEIRGCKTRGYMKTGNYAFLQERMFWGNRLLTI